MMDGPTPKIFDPKYVTLYMYVFRNSFSCVYACVMATARKNGAHPLESQFPIVATNLRALVSSWLPPARDPSPEYDEKDPDEDDEGRPERYLSS